MLYSILKFLKKIEKGVLYYRADAMSGRSGCFKHQRCQQSKIMDVYYFWHNPLDVGFFKIVSLKIKLYEDYWIKGGYLKMLQYEFFIN